MLPDSLAPDSTQLLWEGLSQGKTFRKGCSDSTLTPLLSPQSPAAALHELHQEAGSGSACILTAVPG